MKTTLTTLILILAGVTFAQNEVAYTYDNAGNRLKRESGGTSMIINNNNTEDETMMVSGVELEAHPNPTASNTEVAVIINSETIAPEDKTAIDSGVTMQLADVTGKVLKTQHAGAKSNTPLYVAFNLQGMSNGIYFVKVITENGKLIGEKKILKQ